MCAYYGCHSYCSSTKSKSILTYNSMLTIYYVYTYYEPHLPQASYLQATRTEFAQLATLVHLTPPGDRRIFGIPEPLPALRARHA